MVITIGDKTIALSSTFLISDETPATIIENVDGDLVKFKLYFYPNDGDQPRVDWLTEGDYLRMNFRGWKNSLGTSTKKASKLGTTTTGKNIGFMACHHRVGYLNRVDFQLLLGGAYE